MNMDPYQISETISFLDNLYESKDHITIALINNIKTEELTTQDKLRHIFNFNVLVEKNVQNILVSSNGIGGLFPTELVATVLDDYQIPTNILNIDELHKVQLLLKPYVK